MPNHTSTKLIVTGDNAELDKFIESVKGEKTAFSCNSVIPMPKELAKYMSPVQIVSEEELQNAVEAKKTQEHGMGLPMTDKIQLNLKILYNFDNWYDWAVANWGTKWDVYKVGEWNRTDNSAEISWQSAWSPVVPVIAKLSSMFSGLILTLKFADEGGGFLGYETYSTGEQIDSAEVEWTSDEGIMLREELGCYYDAEEEENE